MKKFTKDTVQKILLHMLSTVAAVMLLASLARGEAYKSPPSMNYKSRPEYPECRWLKTRLDDYFMGPVGGTTWLGTKKFVRWWTKLLDVNSRRNTR